MIQSNAKSLLDNTAMLYKQKASPRHDVCLDQWSFKCKNGENSSNIYLHRETNQTLTSLLSLWKMFYCYPARCVTITFGKQWFTTFPAVKYS